MKIAVVGAGGVGAFFGGCLQRAGHDVALLVTPRHVAPIRDRGLRVTSDDAEFTVHPAVTTDAREIGPVDAVLVTVKTYQLDAAAGEIGPLVGPETIVVTLQNGVTAAPRLRERLGDGHVVPGLAVIVSFLLEPGHVRQIGGRTAITLGPAPLGVAPAGAPEPAADPRVGELAAALADAGVTAQVSRDIDRDLWRKFMLITGFGGVGTLTHATIGEYRSFAPTRSLLTDALAETRALAVARGVGLTDGDVAAVLAQLDSLPADSTASMQRDLMAGHASELEDQTGTLVRLAEDSGVPVPVHSVIYRVLSLDQHRGHI